MLSKEASGTLFGVLGMNPPGSEPGSSGPKATTLLIWPKMNTASNFIKLAKLCPFCFVLTSPGKTLISLLNPLSMDIGIVK